LRVRGGWAYGNFLPYGFVGGAVGRATVTRNARVSGIEGIGGVVTPFDFTATESKADEFTYGVAAGLGVEFALFQNLFVRAEYEYVKFGLFNNLGTYLQSVRAGAGVKF
jgi:opacity protein-like surface antigen